MKKAMIFLISTYQAIASPLIKNLLGIGKICRYSPTCSEYAKISIEKEGVIKGSWLSLNRILRCQPFVFVGGSA